ncbi:lactoylglutathione lyase family protein, diverged [Lachnospiraceae bacterium KM106-2]|nr:lactoylglutathione lyase family protein, diverged [Lachnospiraceae bacterium KM106-2]
MDCHIRSMYLCVKDMERAICFYEELFEKRVLVRDEVYSVFDLDGFRLGLFAYEKMKEVHNYGNNCLPSIDVESKEILEKKIEGLTIPFPVKKIGDNWVAEFIDSEGNQLEITAPVK